MVLLREGAETKPHQWQLTVTAGAKARQYSPNTATQSDLEAKIERAATIESE